MRLTLFAVCAISAVAIRLPAASLAQEDAGSINVRDQVSRIFGLTDQSKDGLLSEKELTNSVKIGVEAGTIPEDAIPVFRSSVEKNLTRKEDVNTRIGLCNIDCLEASLDDTMTKMNVEDDHKGPILSKVADSIQDKIASVQKAANDEKKGQADEAKKEEAAEKEDEQKAMKDMEEKIKKLKKAKEDAQEKEEASAKKAGEKE